MRRFWFLAVRECYPPCFPSGLMFGTNCRQRVFQGIVTPTLHLSYILFSRRGLYLVDTLESHTTKPTRASEQFERTKEGPAMNEPASWLRISTSVPNVRPDASLLLATNASYGFWYLTIQVGLQAQD